MKILKEKNVKKSFIALFLALLGLYYQNAAAQAVVGLDNWYNRETNATTGKPFHYLWTDTEFSGFSQWGEIFQAKGAKLVMIDKPDVSNLDKLDVYIIVDPDTTTESNSPNYLQPDEIQAIVQWVRSGGHLVVMANNATNCEFTHLNQLVSQFGMTFNYVTLHPVTGTNWEMGASKNLPDHPLFKGVSKLYLKEVSSIGLTDNAKAILTENGKVLMAECRYGKGYVIAIGDPWIYNEYIDHERLPVEFENFKAAENFTGYLIKLAGNFKIK